LGNAPRFFWLGNNIYTRIVKLWWDLEKYTNDSFLEKRQRGEGPRISILTDIDNL